MASGSRRRYIDWMRGVAVLIMIEAHTLDAWTRLADRSTITYRNLIVVGGFAAPLFLWLAGLAAVLSAENAFRRNGDRQAASALLCRRGLQVFILAFLFRVQAYLVSPGSSLLTIFRVDILNVMGPSILATGVVWGLCRGRLSRIVTFALLAAAIGLVTPVIRSAAWVNQLPVWIQWQVRPAGEHTVFTLFPWSGFALGGAAVGACLAGLTDARFERRLHVGLAAAGAGLVALGFFTASLPPLYPTSSFWTTSPTYFAIRLGVMMIGLSTVYGLESVVARRGMVLEPLARLGQSSLFVYWIHVELVYGYASWALRRRLPLVHTAVAYALFCLFMYAAVILRDRFVRARRERRGLPGRVEAAPA